MACQQGHLEVCKELLEHDANVNVVNSQGQSCLHLACMYGHFEAVKVIVDHGADLYLKDNQGRTALDNVGISMANNGNNDDINREENAKVIEGIREYLHHAMYPQFKTKADTLDYDSDNDDEEVGRSRSET